VADGTRAAMATPKLRSRKDGAAIRWTTSTGGS